MKYTLLLVLSLIQAILTFDYPQTAFDNYMASNTTYHLKLFKESVIRLENIYDLDANVYIIPGTSDNLVINTLVLGSSDGEDGEDGEVNSSMTYKYSPTVFTGNEYFQCNWVSQNVWDLEFWGQYKPADVSEFLIYFKEHLSETYHLLKIEYLNNAPTHESASYPAIQTYVDSVMDIHFKFAVEYTVEGYIEFTDEDDDPLLYYVCYIKDSVNQCLKNVDGETQPEDIESGFDTISMQYDEPTQFFQIKFNATQEYLNTFSAFQICAYDLIEFGCSTEFNLNFTNTVPYFYETPSQSDGETDILNPVTPPNTSLQEVFNSLYVHPIPNVYIEFAIKEYFFDYDNDPITMVPQYYNYTSNEWINYPTTYEDDFDLWIIYNYTTQSFQGFPEMELLNTYQEVRAQACDYGSCLNALVNISFFNNIPDFNSAINTTQIIDGQASNPQVGQQITIQLFQELAVDLDKDEIFFYIYYADQDDYDAGNWNPMHDDLSLHQCIATYGPTHVENAGEEYIGADGETQQVQGCYLKDSDGNLIDGTTLHDDQWLTYSRESKYIIGTAPSELQDKFYYLKIMLGDACQNSTGEFVYKLDYYNYEPEYNTEMITLQNTFYDQVGIAKVNKAMAFEVAESIIIDKDRDALNYTYFYREDGETEWKENDDFFLKGTIENQIIKFQGIPDKSYLNTVFWFKIVAFDGYKYNIESDGLVLKLDFQNTRPYINEDADSLQDQFDRQNPNPQVGQVVKFQVLDELFLDREGDKLTYTFEFYNNATTQYEPIYNQWLGFNELFFYFYGIPTIAYMDLYYFIRVKASDGNADSDFLSFYIDLTNNKPEINPLIPTFQQQFDLKVPNCYKYLGKTLTFSFEFNPFFDSDNDKLYYEAWYTYDDINNSYDVLKNSWLQGNSDKLFFVGVPPLSLVNRKMYIKINANDGFKKSDDLYIIMNFKNNAPTQNPLISADLQQQFDAINPNPQVGQKVQFSLKSVFFDQDSDPLYYYSEYQVKKNGSVTQNWKVMQNVWFIFYEEQLLFSGTPTSDFMDCEFNVRVSATDGFETSNFLYFTINLENSPPYINKNTESIQETFDQEYPITQVYQSIKFTVNGDKFLDDDKTDKLTFVAQYKDPSTNSWKILANEWLTFNQQNFLLKGEAPESMIDKVFQLRFYATDGYKNSEYDYLNINFFDISPQLGANSQSGQQQLAYYLQNGLTKLVVDKPFSFTLYDDTYQDDDSPNLQYTAYLKTRYQFNSEDYKVSHRRLQQDPNDQNDPTYRYSCRADSEISNKYPWDPKWSDKILLQGSAQADTWLKFNKEDLKFSGVPQGHQVGDYQLIVEVSDGVKKFDDIIYFKICNTSPYVNNKKTLQSQITKQPKINQQWTIDLDPETFIDNDYDELTYEAVQEDGSPLPGYLKFSPDKFKISGKFPEISKKEVKNFIDAIFYSSAIRVKITATDPIGEKASDVLVIEVQSTFEYALSIIIQILGYLTLFLGFIKFRPLLFAVFCKRKYTYHYYNQAVVGIPFEKQISFIGGETYYAQIIWAKFLYIQKKKIMAQNFQRPKDQKIDVGKWVYHLFISEDLVFNKQLLMQELQEAKQTLKYDSNFMNLIDKNGQKTNLYKVLKYMVYIEIIQQNKELSQIAESLKKQISIDFSQEKMTSKYNQLDQNKQSVKIYNGKKNSTQTPKIYKDWYHPICQFIYSNISGNNNLLQYKKFSKIYVNQKYLDQIYDELYQKAMLQKKEDRTALPSQQFTDQNRIQNINFLRKFIISSAQGIDIFKYTNPPEISSGENVIMHIKQLDYVQALQKVEVFRLSDKIRSMFPFFKLDYRLVTLSENQLLPNWLSVEQKHDTIIIKGTPTMNDIGEIKIQLLCTSGFILKEFFIRTFTAENAQFVNWDEYKKDHKVKKIKNKINDNDQDINGDFKKMYINQVEGYDFSREMSDDELNSGLENTPQIKDQYKQVKNKVVQMEMAKNKQLKPTNKQQIKAIQEKRVVKKQHLMGAYGNTQKQENKKRQSNIKQIRKTKSQLKSIVDLN